MKSFVLFLFHIFNLPKRDLYAWLLLEGARRRGTAADEYKDITKKGAAKAPAAAPDLPDEILRILLGDDYSKSVKDDIARLTAATGRSVYDFFDDDPIFAGFGRLRRLARNREFEIKYYGRVR